MFKTFKTLKTKKPLRALFAEVRPNCEPATTAAPMSWAVAHQSPFPWLNTIAFLPSEPGAPRQAGG